MIWSTEILAALTAFMLFILLMVTMVVFERRGNEQWRAKIKHKRIMSKLWNMEACR